MEINLLTPQQSNRRDLNLPFAILRVITAVIVIGFLAGYGLVYFLDYQGRNRMAEAQREIDQLQQVNRQLQAEAALRQGINLKENLIKTVDKEKPIFSGPIEQIRNLLPLGTQITDLDLKSAGVNPATEINIQGEAPRYLVVSQLGRNLQESEFFKDAVINVARRDSGKNTVSFTIQITRKGSGQ